MYAMKCDRCGGYYDGNMIKITGGNCSGEKFEKISVRGENNFCCYYDLCDRCASDFFHWINDPDTITGGDANGQEDPETVQGAAERAGTE